MRLEEDLLGESAEDLFENAPCGYLSTALDGTLLKVNRTFESWTGHDREELIGAKRFSQLLSGGGRIYHETHYAPLLRMQGEAKEIALEIIRADGSRLPVLVNSVVMNDADGNPQAIRTIVFDASDRRSYEEELLRARRREREIAQQLQRSLLAGELPSAPGLELDASYRPADDALDVGGDWYDAFWLSERRVGLVIGDVVGRGIEAAATMGQLRSATRALASTGLPPGPLLEALDAYSDRHRVGGMATLVYAELDLPSRELRFACAGHLPPVVALAGEEPRLIWDGRSTPLGVPPQDGDRRAEATCRLGSGSVVALYTDGLVERRSRSIDTGIERLLEEVEANRTEPPSRLAPILLRLLDTAEHQDDACVMVLAFGEGG
ncbi:MAG TPA: SpoIIE family protein phosphatase [Solirubrobacterales bacterium]|nr:SpoIIE family protein phosphatase [Solirubrobacterales bacterium]